MTAITVNTIYVSTKISANSNFTLSGQMSQVIKSTRVHARDLYRIRPLLDLKI